MGLTTLLGTAQLDVQDAIRRGVSGGRAPNLVIVSLGRTAVNREFGADDTHIRSRMRREIESGVRRTIDAHGWIIGGCGDLSVNVLVRSIDCAVSASAHTVPSFAELRVQDDDGSRIAAMVTIQATVGREHRPQPPGFISLHDPSRTVSRRHLALCFEDLELRAHLVGRNPTTLNGNLFDNAREVVLSVGDIVRCGSCEISVAAIAGS